jgi:MinD superfamily P-loop ATPase
MTTIAVFSGKGGTGKTTLVACFARLAGRSVAVDCDVDAANLQLLLPGEDLLREPFLAGHRATIDPGSCLGCGACAEACHFDAIGPAEERWRVDPLACEGCGVCELVCPSVGTIRLHENLAGHWMLRHSRDTILVHAALGVAQDNSGKLVVRVREEAAQQADHHGLPLVLVDGPPGIGCPVHAAMGGVDRCLAVTEPTPSGQHDLERLLRLAAHFGVPVCAAVNKWNLAPSMTRRIEQACADHGVPVAGRIPWDAEVPRMLAQSRIPLEAPAQEETVASIKSLWDRTLRGPVAVPEYPRT